MGRIHDSILGHAISQRQEKDLFLQNKTETTLASLVCKVGRYLARKYSFQICLSRLSNLQIRNLPTDETFGPSCSISAGSRLYRGI